MQDVLQRRNNFLSFFNANYLVVPNNFVLSLSLSLSLSYNLGISSLIPLSAHSALVRSESLCPFVEGNSLPSFMVVYSEIKNHIQNLL